MSHGVPQLNVLEKFATTIRSEWDRQPKDAFKLAALCRRAQAAVPLHERALLIAKIGIDKSTFSKLVNIDLDERLKVVWVRATLPNHYPTLDCIRRFTDYQLAAALDDGIITQETRT
ncbi:MAG: hypothetical protein H0U98_10250 [Alphaproteobacteria bacterium]|nr:hypothetical protein [Alphaproteobacteria bacterium]